MRPEYFLFANEKQAINVGRLAKNPAPRPGKQRKPTVGRCLAAAVFDKMLFLRRY